MSSHTNIRQYTRRPDLQSDFSSGWTPEELTAGALLRIADAAEAMARSHTDLEARFKRLQDHHYEVLAHRNQLVRQRAALRGVITRMKRAAS